MPQVATKYNCPYCGAKAYNNETNKCDMCNQGELIGLSQYTGSDYSPIEFKITQITDPITYINDPLNRTKKLATIEVKFNKDISSLITADKSIVLVGIHQSTINPTSYSFITEDGDVPTNFSGTMSHSTAIVKARGTIYSLKFPNLQLSVDKRHWVEVWEYDNTTNTYQTLNFIPKEEIILK